jgi:hypothetical protein
MSNASYDFLGGERMPYWPTKSSSFGDVITGKICEEPFTQQQTDQKGERKTYDNGDPMLQLVVTLQTDMRDPDIEEDNGKRRLYVKGATPHCLRNAVAQAVREAKCKGLDVGGDLTVVYTHDAKTEYGSDARQFTATYAPPSPSTEFLGTHASGNGAATPTLPPGITAEVWASLPGAAKAAMLGAQAAPEPEPMPPGMTREVWDTLTPEARTALMGLVKQ